MPSMPSAAIEAAARLLVDTRRANALLAALPADLTPPTIADAYAVQDRVRVLWGERVVAWKAGATALPVQQKFGLGEPFAGPAFAPDTVSSPARLPAARFAHLALESEFAFRFGSTVPPRATPYTREEVLAAVDALVPAIEIVNPRFETLPFGRGTTAIADCAVNGGLVTGEPVGDFRDLDLAAHAVRLEVDGEVKAEGTGALVLGDPVTSLLWTINHLSARGITLAPGELISTGTTTGIVYVAPGATAVADFGTLGAVEVTFDGPAHPRRVAPA